MPARILLVDPRPGQREALELALDGSDWTLQVAEDARRASAVLDGEGAEVAICDPALEGLDGFELVPQLLRRRPTLHVLLSVDPGDRERFECAARVDAVGLVAHPIDPDEIRFTLRAARRRIEGDERLRLLERDLQDAVGDKPIVGASEPMIELLEAMERASGFKTPVLVEGEAGTHREVLARAIHAQSLRRAGPFVAVRCNAASPQALEAAMFGGTRGTSPQSPMPDARAADGGTLFIDDLERLPLPAQQRLLHLLDREEVVDPRTEKARHVDVRVIVATRSDPAKAVEAAELDAELRDRLSSVVLRVPPLRQRSEDIPLLVDHAVASMRAELGVEVDGVSDTAMDRLRHYDWPGNLRELENVIERAMLLCTTDRITLRELPPAIATAVAGEGDGRSGDFSLRRARRSFEAEMIRRALRKTDGNRTRAARLLEISHRALLYKIKEFGLRDA